MSVAKDETDELHRRFDAIAAHYGVTFRQLIDGGLRRCAARGRCRSGRHQSADRKGRDDKFLRSVV